MPTDEQIAANRRNAQLSTGPKTPEGKAAIGLNHLQHGLYATTIVLPGEDPEEFQKLCDEYQSFYQPQNVVEQDLVDQLAAAKWRIRRTARIEAAFMADGDSQEIDRRLANLNRITQCQTRLYRQWDKLRKDLDATREARQSTPKEKDDDPDQWATPEEWAQQKITKPKNCKPPKELELTWRPDPNGPEKVIARIYKGKNVAEFPDED